MPARWELRFENFERAVSNLEEALAQGVQRPLSELEQAGSIKRYELCWELGWKVLRDYIADSGTPLDIPSAVNAIRGGLALGLIEDGDGWIAAMKLRNRMAHEYNHERVALALAEIGADFLPLFRKLRQRLGNERT